MAAHNMPPDDDDRFQLIELDLPTTAPATAPAPIVAPAITAPPVAPSPLDAGRALLAAATHEAALDDAAHEVARICEAAGLDKASATRTELRDLYRARKAEIVRAAWLAMFAALWLRIWASLARGVEIRPALVVRPVERVPCRECGSSVPHVGLPWNDCTLWSVKPDPTLPVAPVAASELTASVLSFEAQLGGIVAEGASNASTHGAGSLAGGQLRIVGFADAAGYVLALQNGVKAGTAAGYQQTLRTRYGYTDAQIAALTVTIIPEAALPVGAGIRHDNQVDGKSVFDLAREARAAATKVVRETADATTLALAQRLVVDDSPLAWWEAGWKGSGSITRTELIAACGEAPEPKVNSTQLARTMDGLRGTHDATMVTVRPQGVKVRWQIGRGKQHAAYVGAEYGTVLAIVDLLSDGSLAYEGDTTIADEVRAEFARLCGDEVLRPGDVTAWLSQLLRKRYGAVRNGDRYLLAPQHKDAARELCGKIAKVWSVGGWVRGRLVDGVPELGVTYQDVATVIGGIWQGLSDEVAEAEARWVKTVTDAKLNKPGLRACQGELDRLDGVKADGSDGLRGRLNDLRIVGEGPLAPLRARVTALRATVKAAWDDASDPTSQRAALLDLD